MHKRNEMMDRPVINNEVREYLRRNQKQLTGYLKNLQNLADENRNPVIPHETVIYFIWLFEQIQPKNILEIGTAIGFSASIFAEYSDAHIQTIERNPTMIEKAKNTFSENKLENRITLLEGQAEEILKKLPNNSFDFIFMDSAKAKYYDFFPYCIDVLEKGGILAVDDVLQGGTILDPIEDIPKRVRKIHKKLNSFLDIVLDHPALTSTILPLGDGLLLITKKENYNFHQVVK